MRTHEVQRTVLLVLLGIAACLALSGTTWIKPTRGLPEADRLDLAISLADGIVVGELLDVRQNRSGSGYISEYFLVRPIQWLVSGGTRDTVAVGLALTADGAALALQQLLDSESRLAVFFLRASRASPGRWLLSESPYAYGGILPTSSPSSVSASIRDVVDRQSPDSLIARSDLVAVGRVTSRRPCPSGGSRGGCFAVVVDSTLWGEEPMDTILVRPVFSSHVPDGPGVFFLSRTANGVYEPISFKKGSLRIEGGVVERLSLRTDSLSARAAVLRSLR